MTEHETIPGAVYAVEAEGHIQVINPAGVVVYEGENALSFPAVHPRYEITPDSAAVRQLFKLAPRLRLTLLQGVAGGWLPKGFTELEYLESPSTPENAVNAFFRLPLKNVENGVDTLEYETSHSFEEFGSALQGEGIVDNYNTFFVGNNASQNGKYVSIDGVLYNENYISNINKKFTCSNEEWHTLHHFLGNRKTPEWRLFVDGELQVFMDSLQFNPTTSFKNNFYLFGTNSGHGLCGKKRTAKIRVNGALIYDLVPVLDETGAPGFYDRKNKKMYYNAGIGDFIYPATEAATFSLRRVAPYVPEFAQLTPRGVRRLYRVPDGYSGGIDEYAAEHGYKRLVESPPPEDGYWSPSWRETEAELRLEWQEMPEPQEEELLTE